MNFSYRQKRMQKASLGLLRFLSFAAVLALLTPACALRANELRAREGHDDGKAEVGEETAEFAYRWLEPGRTRELEDRILVDRYLEANAAALARNRRQENFFFGADEPEAAAVVIRKNNRTGSRRITVMSVSVNTNLAIRKVIATFPEESFDEANGTFIAVDPRSVEPNIATLSLLPNGSGAQYSIWQAGNADGVTIDIEEAEAAKDACVFCRGAVEGVALKLVELAADKEGLKHLRACKKQGTLHGVAACAAAVLTTVFAVNVGLEWLGTHTSRWLCEDLSGLCEARKVESCFGFAPSDSAGGLRRFTASPVELVAAPPLRQIPHHVDIDPQWDGNRVTRALARGIRWTADRIQKQERSGLYLRTSGENDTRLDYLFYQGTGVTPKRFVAKAFAEASLIGLGSFENPFFDRWANAGERYEVRRYYGELGEDKFVSVFDRDEQREFPLTECR